MEIGRTTGPWPLIHHSDNFMRAAGDILHFIGDVQAGAIPGPPPKALEGFEQMAINLLATSMNSLIHAGKMSSEPSEIEAILVRRGRIETRAEALMVKDKAKTSAKDTKHGAKRSRRRRGN